MSTTRSSQSPVIYGWGDCLNNKLSNGVVQKSSNSSSSTSSSDDSTAETSSSGSSGIKSLLDSMPPPPPTWNRPKKVASLGSLTLTRNLKSAAAAAAAAAAAEKAEGGGSDSEEDDFDPPSSNSGLSFSTSSAGPIIIHGISCGAHNSAFIATGGIFGETGAVLMAGAGRSTYGTTLLCDVAPSNSNSSIGSTSSGSKDSQQQAKQQQIEEKMMLHSPLGVPVVLPRPGALSAQVVTQVSLGNYHAALVTRTGQCYTWGWGAMGQLGHGDGNNKAEPTHVLSLYSAQQVACGTKFTAVVTLFGELYVFGENEQGQLGLGNCQRQLSPVQCKRLAPYTVIHVDASSSHMAAVSIDADLSSSFPAGSPSSSPYSSSTYQSMSFGGFGGGAIGNAAKDSQMLQRSPSNLFLFTLERQQAAEAAANARSLTTSPSSSSLNNGGNQQEDNDGSSGDKTASASTMYPFLNLACFNPLTASKSCGGVASRVWTWGQSSSSGKIETLPKEIVSMRGLGVCQVSCGEFHNLALSTLGQVFEWKIGEVPIHVGGALQGHIIRAIDAGAFHSIALSTSGKLFSWGRSKTGQLGRTDTGDLTKPGMVSFSKERKIGKESTKTSESSSSSTPTKLTSESPHVVSPSINVTATPSSSTPNSSDSDNASAPSPANPKGRLPAASVGASSGPPKVPLPGVPPTAKTAGVPPSPSSGSSNPPLSPNSLASQTSPKEPATVPVRPKGPPPMPVIPPKVGAKPTSSTTPQGTTASPVKPPSSSATPSQSSSNPSSTPASATATATTSSRSNSPAKDSSSTKPAPTTPSTPSNDSNVATKQPFIARIAAGEYHNVAIIERDPRRLLLWKMLKKERSYLLKLHVLVDMYMATLIQLDEGESLGTSPDWQKLLGEAGVVGTQHAITTSNSTNFTLYKQYHSLAASYGEGGQGNKGTATASDFANLPAGHRRSQSSPRHRSQSATPRELAGSPKDSKDSKDSSKDSKDSVSSNPASTMMGLGGSGGTNSSNTSGSGQMSSQDYRQMLAGAEFSQVVLSVFGNLNAIYRAHSQFVQELSKVVEETYYLGSDTRAVVDSVMTFWRFRLGFFSLYAFYADQYTQGAYNLFLLSKAYPHVAAAVKQVNELANSRFWRSDATHREDFSLKHLLLEPLRHVALETHLLRRLQDLCLLPTAQFGGKKPTKDKLTQNAPLPTPLSSGSSSSARKDSAIGNATEDEHAKTLSRRPSLPSRPTPPQESLPPSLSNSQLSWHAPYLYATSSVVSLDETLSHMSGLLERVCKNFNFVDATEILTSTMDERGFPQISGGSVESLVKRLTHHSFTDQEFVNAFLLTYRNFMTPIQFMNLMSQRYHNTYPPGLDDKEKEAYNQLVRIPIQNRVVQVLLQWVQSPLSSYDWNPKRSITNPAASALSLDSNQQALHAAMNNFCSSELMKDPENDKEKMAYGLMLTGLLKIAVKTAGGGPQMEGRNIIMVGPAIGSNNVGDVPPEMLTSKPSSALNPASAALVADIHSVLHFEDKVRAIACTLAYQDFIWIKEVAAKDFLNKTWTRDNFSTLAPGLHALTQRFNQLGSWVCYEVVNAGDTPKDRAQTMALFVSVASELLELRDYNAFVAIISGLNNSSVSRLKKTAAKVSGKVSEKLNELAEIASGKDNYRIMRHLWTQALPPSVPFLALTLKDLTFIEDGNPDKLEDGSTNFYKYRKMAEVISLCLGTRDVIPSYKIEVIFDTYLKKQFETALALGEEGLYKLSKKKE